MVKYKGGFKRIMKINRYSRFVNTYIVFVKARFKRNYIMIIKHEYSAVAI